MLSNIILRSTAAFGGAPFRLIKCTALSSASGGAAGGAAVGVFLQLSVGSLTMLTIASALSTWIAYFLSRQRLLPGFTAPFILIK